jgi:hypothetical protein
VAAALYGCQCQQQAQRRQATGAQPPAVCPTVRGRTVGRGRREGARGRRGARELLTSASSLQTCNVTPKNAGFDPVKEDQNPVAEGHLLGQIDRAPQNPASDPCLIEGEQLALLRATRCHLYLCGRRRRRRRRGPWVSLDAARGRRDSRISTDRHICNKRTRT